MLNVNNFTSQNFKLKFEFVLQSPFKRGENTANILVFLLEMTTSEVLKSILARADRGQQSVLNCWPSMATREEWGDLN